MDGPKELVLPDSRFDFVHIIMLCVMHGNWVAFIGGTCFVCDGMCEHLHNPVGLRDSLGTLGEMVHLEHFVCMYSYIGVA